MHSLSFELTTSPSILFLQGEETPIELEHIGLAWSNFQLLNPYLPSTTEISFFWLHKTWKPQHKISI